LYDFSERTMTGFVRMGHNPMKKLADEQIPYFYGDLSGGVFNLDFDLSEGYSDMGSILTIGLRDKNGQITGVRRWGYRVKGATTIEDLTLEDLNGASKPAE